MAKARSGTLMAKCISATGKMINSMAMEVMCMQQGHNIMGNGIVISSMDLGKSCGLMGLFLKVFISMDLNMDRGIMYGLIRVNMLEIGTIIKLKDMVHIVGRMGGSMKGIGKVRKCMGKGYIRGRMEEGMKEIIFRIRNMGLEFILGLMVDLIMECGKMEFRTEEGNFICRMEILEREFGRGGKG